MSGLEKRAQGYLDKKKKYDAFKSVVFVLALVVIVGVFAKLSLTGVAKISTDDLTGGFDKDSAINLEGSIKNPVVNNATPKAGTDDVVTATVSFDYSLASDNTVSATTTNKYVYLKLDDDISALNDKREGEVVDAAYTAYLISEGKDTSGDKAASGDYYISDDGTIIIKFRDEYLEWLGESGTGVSGGSFELTADFTRTGDRGSSTYDFNLGGATAEVPGFKVMGMGIDKSGKDNGDGTITWTATINNPNYNTNSQDQFTMNNWIVDDMLGNLAAGTEVTVSYDLTTWSQGQGWHTTGEIVSKTVPVHPTEKNGKTEYTLWASEIGNSYRDNSGTHYFYSPTITITYTTPFDTSNPTYNEGLTSYESSSNNTVNLCSNNKTISKEASVVKYSDIGLEKTKTADNYADGTQTWEITLDNSDGLDLNGMYVTDTFFTRDGIEFTVSSSNGEAVAYTLDKANGKIVFTGENKSPAITITYTAAMTEDEQGINTAAVYDKDGNKFDEKFVYYSFSALYAEKSGTVDKTNGLINWTVKLETQAQNLNGYVFEDSMLQYAESVTATGDSWKTGNISIAKNDDGKYVVTATENQNVAYISYSTPLYVDENNTYGGIKNAETGLVSYKNTGKFGNGPGTISQTFEKEVTDSDTNEISKTVGNQTYSADYKTYTVEWTVNTKQNPGTFYGKTMTDTLQIPEGFSLSSSEVTVEGKQENGSQIQLTKDTNYTLVNSASGFGIEFKPKTDSNPLDLLYEVNVKYKTIFTVDFDKVEAGVDYSIGNTVSFNNKNSNTTTKYSRPDYSNPPYEKLINGEKELTLNKDDLASFKDTNGENYIFTYKIQFTDRNKLLKDSQKKLYLFSDTLPEGFELVSVDGINAGPYQNDYTSFYTYDSANRKLDIGIIAWWNNDYIQYTVKVPCQTVDEKIENGGYTFTNTVVHDEFVPVEQKLKVEPKEVLDEGVVDKTGKRLSAGYFQYSIDVNKDGNNLVGDGETLTLVDTMVSNGSTVGKGTYGDTSDTTNSPATNREFVPELSYIKVYRLNADGSQGSEITGWSYTLKANDSKVEKRSIQSSEFLTSVVENGNGFPWGSPYFSFDVEPGKTYNFTFVRKDGINASGITIGILRLDYSINSGNINLSYDANGNAKYSFTVPSTVSSGACYAAIWNGADSVEKVEIECVETSSLSKLTISNLPDATPMRIVYTYKGASSAGEYVSVNVTNTALLNGTGYKDYSTDDFVVSEKSGATSTGEQYLKLQKVDVGNGQLTLSSGFRLYKYENGKWIPAIGIQPPENIANAKFKVVTWASSSEIEALDLVKRDDETLNLQLASGVMYKIHENIEPDYYLSQAANSEIDEYFGAEDGYVTDFYFCFLSAPETIPPEANNYRVVGSGSTYNVKNVRKVDVTVEKNWIGLPAVYADTVKAEFAVFRTTDLSSTDNAERVDLSKYVEAGTSFVNFENNTLILSKSGSSEVLNDLPNGQDNNGDPYYYFVREVRYTLDGNDWVEVGNSSSYKPIYYGNNTNGDSTISVTNTSELTIKKIWKDYDNQTITNISSYPDIQVDLYRVLDDGSRLTNAKIYTDANKVGTYTLKASEGFQLTIDTSQFYTSEDAGKSFKYYIKEADLEGYSTSYNGNGSNGVSVIQIFNKSTTPTPEEERYTLPETGGIGTDIYRTIGIVIMTLTAICLIIKKRNKI